MPRPFTIANSRVIVPNSVVNPTVGEYEGIYTSRTYEVDMLLDARPASVTVDGTKCDNWSYENGWLKVTFNQPDVRKKATLVVE